MVTVERTKEHNLERKEWLTLVYREANRFIELHGGPQSQWSEVEVDEMEPELHQQVQQVLASCDSLEDVVKFSLLKNPSPDLWYGESMWSRVLVGVAGECLTHDVKGIAQKILSGELPAAASSRIE